MKKSPQEQQLKQLRNMWEWHSTEELLDVWQKNHRYEWTDEVFEVIGQILLTRLEIVPPQGEPVFNAPSQKKNPSKWLAVGVALSAILIAALLLFFSFRSRVEVLRDETQTITLTQSSNPKHLVYENDIVQISIGYDQFLAYSDTISLTNHNIEGFVAAMLEEGQAVVFDKRSQSYVNTVQWRTYTYLCGPLCCGEFYYFYLPDSNFFNPNGTQFLELQTGIC